MLKTPRLTRVVTATSVSSTDAPSTPRSIDVSYDVRPQAVYLCKSFPVPLETEYMEEFGFTSDANAQKPVKDRRLIDNYTNSDGGYTEMLDPETYMGLSITSMLDPETHIRLSDEQMNFHKYWVRKGIRRTEKGVNQNSNCDRLFGSMSRPSRSRGDASPLFQTVEPHPRVVSQGRGRSPLVSRQRENLIREAEAHYRLGPSDCGARQRLTRSAIDFAAARLASANRGHRQRSSSPRASSRASSVNSEYEDAYVEYDEDIYREAACDRLVGLSRSRGPVREERCMVSLRERPVCHTVRVNVNNPTKFHAGPTNLNITVNGPKSLVISRPISQERTRVVNVVRDRDYDWGLVNVVRNQDYDWGSASDSGGYDYVANNVHFMPRVPCKSGPGYVKQWTKLSMEY